MTAPTGKAVEILLIEDSPGDVRLAKEALRDSKIYNKLHVIEDGVKAIEYLRKKGSYANETRPDLILLDLNLPRKDGREVLAEIKGDDDLKRIPVVILTISTDEEDILKTYNLHANCYISKPLEVLQFIKVVKAIEDFWFTIVKLPPNSVT
ncbi:response regulator [candidate division WOR-3 bacterium]|nr:response regulator [candidate division WOR-3 bacterium]